jgi:hypothetical protein
LRLGTRAYPVSSREEAEPRPNDRDAAAR